MKMEKQLDVFGPGFNTFLPLYGVAVSRWCLVLFAGLAALTACVSFNNRVYKAEMTATALADRAMSAWGTYWDSAIKNPAANGTTAEKLWEQRDTVNRASKAFAGAVERLDKLRMDYAAKLATAEQVRAGVDEVEAATESLVKSINNALPAYAQIN